MKNRLKFIPIALIMGIVTLNSCGNAEQELATGEATNTEEVVVEEVVYDTNSVESMLAAVAQACGGFDNLKALNDVEFDYNYVHPDGKKDVSKERYIFEKEIAWARYTQHEVNVSPELEGDMVQFFNGEKSSVYNNGETMDDPKVVGTGQFLRQANYMWFTMMFKLTDPGTISEYKGQEEIDGVTYDVVMVTYDSESTGKEQNDTFILHINPETKMVESFKFSLPAFGVEQPVLLAKLSYTEIDGIHVISNREMFAPAPDGSGMAPMVSQTLENIKFNNGFTEEQLSKDI